jgi:hypothetical protein
VTAVSEEVVKRSPAEILPLVESVETADYRLDLRHPVHPRDSVQPEPDARPIIVRKSIFQPTSFASFETFYAEVIPYPHSDLYKSRLAEE